MKLERGIKDSVPTQKYILRMLRYKIWFVISEKSVKFWCKNKSFLKSHKIKEIQLEQIFLYFLVITSNFQPDHDKLGNTKYRVIADIGSHNVLL